MKWLKQLWWLFTDRTLEYDTDHLSPALAAKVNSQPPLSFRDGWVLVQPRWHWRFLIDMPCGCQRFPLRRKPHAFKLNCPEHWTLGSDDRKTDAHTESVEGGES